MLFSPVLDWTPSLSNYFNRMSRNSNLFIPFLVFNITRWLSFYLWLLDSTLHMPRELRATTIGKFCRTKSTEASILNSTWYLDRYTLATSFTFYSFVQCFTWNSVPGSSLLLGHYCNFNSFYSSAPYPRVWNNSNSLVSHKAWYGVARSHR